MIKLGIAGVIAVMLAAAFVAAVDEQTSANAAESGRQGIGRINITATLTHGTARAVGAPGRASNASEQAWRLTDRYGRQIGRMLLQCRWILSRARFCNGEIALPRGKITVAGSSETTFDGEWAVTGGTGTYAAGGGVMLFTAIGLRKNVLLITIQT